MVCRNTTEAIETQMQTVLTITLKRKLQDSERFAALRVDIPIVDLASASYAFFDELSPCNLWIWHRLLTLSLTSFPPATCGDLLIDDRYPITCIRLVLLCWIQSACYFRKRYPATQKRTLKRNMLVPTSRRVLISLETVHARDIQMMANEKGTGLTSKSLPLGPVRTEMEMRHQ